MNYNLAKYKKYQETILNQIWKAWQTDWGKLLTLYDRIEDIIIDFTIEGRVTTRSITDNSNQFILFSVSVMMEETTPTVSATWVTSSGEATHGPLLDRVLLKSVVVDVVTLLSAHQLDIIKLDKSVRVRSWIRITDSHIITPLNLGQTPPSHCTMCAGWPHLTLVFILRQASRPK